MLVLALAGVLVGLYFLIRGKRGQLKEKGIVYFISFVVLLELFAVLANVSGRYNGAKTLLTSGYISVIIGIEFLWTARLLLIAPCGLVCFVCPEFLFLQVNNGAACTYAGKGAYHR